MGAARGALGVVVSVLTLGASVDVQGLARRGRRHVERGSSPSRSQALDDEALRHR
jgi:hypothetical protein